ncbi:MAG: hypothetical protein AMXMBFR7_40420 [Planctomycetota bacterium]
MSVRRIALKVTEQGGCPLLRTGERWIFENGRLDAADGAVCAHAVCSVFPTLERMLESGTPGQALPEATLHCNGAGCSVAFRIQESIGAGAAPLTALSGRQGAASGPFLARLSPVLAGKLVAAAKPSSYAAGDSILEEGVMGEALHVIGDGEVEVVRKNPQTGQETLLAVLGWGECFGEMSLVTGEPTSAAVRARGPVKILALSRNKLEDLLASSPELNRIFAHLLADRLRALNLTLQAERGRGIRGKLSMLTLGDLVQTLHASRRTGTLTIHKKAEEARVYFVGGQIKAAELGEHESDEAFYDLSLWLDGDFAFAEGQPVWPESAAVTRDTMGLLMESLRRFDETQRIPKRD